MGSLLVLARAGRARALNTTPGPAPGRGRSCRALSPAGLPGVLPVAPHTFRMRLGANRDDDRPADPAAYWRRRFLILAVGLAVLGVLAWMFTRARPVLSAAASAGRTSAAATQAGDPLPS